MLRLRPYIYKIEKAWTQLHFVVWTFLFETLKEKGAECTVHDLICPGICTTDPLTESLPITFMNLDIMLGQKGCHFALICSF